MKILKKFSYDDWKAFALLFYSSVLGLYLILYEPHMLAKILGVIIMIPVEVVLYRTLKEVSQNTINREKTTRNKNKMTKETKEFAKVKLKDEKNFIKKIFYLIPRIFGFFCVFLVFVIIFQNL